MDDVDVSVASVVVLGGLVLLRFVIVGVGAALLLRPVRECPACFAHTVRVKRPVLEAVTRIAEWRWCTSCGWQGLGRVSEGGRWSRRNAASQV
jgi:hypothetical protein